MIDSDQYHEALECPKCPGLYLESLWSLIAHVNCSHHEISDILTFSSLQKCKKIVLKSKVCVIRPAFKEDGTRNDYLNFGPDGCYLKDESKSMNENRISTSLSSELASTAISSINSSSTSSTDSPTNSSTHSTTNPSTFISFNNVLDMIATGSTTIHEKQQRQSSSTPEYDTVSSPTVINPRKLQRQISYTRSIKKQICQTCGEIFNNRCLLTLHMMKHKKKTHPYQCMINGCFQCYDTKLKFKSHLTRVHRDLTQNEIDEMLNKKSRSTVIEKNDDKSGDSDCNNGIRVKSEIL